MTEAEKNLKRLLKDVNTKAKDMLEKEINWFGEYVRNDYFIKDIETILNMLEEARNFIKDGIRTFEDEEFRPAFDELEKMLGENDYEVSKE